MANSQTEERVETVDCLGEKHTIRIGVYPKNNSPMLILNNHTGDEVRSEMVIEAMDGKTCGCMEFIRAWRNSTELVVVSCDKKAAFRLYYRLKD